MPAAEGSGASVRYFGTNGWQSRRLWQKRRTTPPSRGQKSATVIREEEVHELYDGPRAQKRPPPGERPGILAESGPQRSDHTVRRSSGDNLPTLALPVLAGSAGEVVDISSLVFLTRSREEEEKVQAMLEEVRDFDGWNQATGSDHVQFFWHRRFGHFLPLPRGGRGRKGGRRSFLALAALVVDIGSGVFAMLVLLVPMHLVMCSLWSMTGPCCSATRPVWTRRTVFSSWLCSGICEAFDACRQARRQVCVMAGVDQKDRFVVPCRKLRKIRS